MKRLVIGAAGAAVVAGAILYITLDTGHDGPPKPHKPTAADRSALEDAARWVISDTQVKAGECIAAYAQRGTSSGLSCFRDPRANAPIGKMTMVDGVYHFDAIGGYETITSPDGGQVCVTLPATVDDKGSVADGACANFNSAP